MTKEIWHEYLGKKCSQGFSFKDTVVECISEFEKRFTERKVIAGSIDAYRTFGKFYLNCLRHFEDERAEAFAESLGKKSNLEFTLRRQDK